MERETIEVPIVGVSPLIPHAWSEKAKGMMRAKQTSPTTARAKLAPKDANAEAEASLYRLDDGRPGMPATAFKAATVAASRFYGKDVTLVSLKAALFVNGDGDDQLVPILGEMTRREDTPRNSGGSADLRYRYAFWPWSAILTITFLPAIIDAESVVNLVDAGGNGGVGDWRPTAPKSLTGTFGRYQVAL
ncbi:hypothetical protein A5731_22765 [Mycolicibacterium conceptionense]|uniref:Uncharacterized protein n=1 Tax=Mycolicibacterium conceptionense TaxID=451644 RepID=A0A1A1X8I8_9MYCO|nr:hypothetical protein A5731_22765 [Mycolicibacterium conceptionense]OBF15051.1 hypothetical protein A5726_23005 [Mycolicibacterium conceptionense]